MPVDRVSTVDAFWYPTNCRVWLPGWTRAGIVTVIATAPAASTTAEPSHSGSEYRYTSTCDRGRNPDTRSLTSPPAGLPSPPPLIGRELPSAPTAVMPTVAPLASISTPPAGFTENVVRTGMPLTVPADPPTTTGEDGMAVMTGAVGVGSGVEDVPPPLLPEPPPLEV